MKRKKKERVNCKKERKIILLPLKILVKCPHCNGKFVTSSVKTVQCKWCGKFFRIYRKRGISRIVKIVKGNRILLWKKIGVN